MVSMCFQLMQDEIVAKVRWLLQKCGIKKKAEDKSVTTDAEKDLPVIAVTPPPARPRTAITSRKKVKVRMIYPSQSAQTAWFTSNDVFT